MCEQSSPVGALNKAGFLGFFCDFLKKSPKIVENTGFWPKRAPQTPPKRGGFGGVLGGVWGAKNREFEVPSINSDGLMK